MSIMLLMLARMPRQHNELNAARPETLNIYNETELHRKVSGKIKIVFKTSVIITT